jgi:hypothetical protein
MKTYADETIELAITRADELHTQFVAEVKRLLKSGAVDSENHSRGLLFAVVLENMADSFSIDRKSGEYKNLKCF